MDIRDAILLGGGSGSGAEGLLQGTDPRGSGDEQRVHAVESLTVSLPLLTGEFLQGRFQELVLERTAQAGEHSAKPVRGRSARERRMNAGAAGRPHLPQLPQESRQTAPGAPLLSSGLRGTGRRPARRPPAVFDAATGR